MKALSIKQPWAQLIIMGAKDVENRSRRTSFRGRFAVHVSLKRANYEDVDIEAIPRDLREPVKLAWERNASRVELSALSNLSIAFETATRSGQSMTTGTGCYATRGRTHDPDRPKAGSACGSGLLRDLKMSRYRSPFGVAGLRGRPTHLDPPATNPILVGRTVKQQRPDIVHKFRAGVPSPS